MASADGSGEVESSISGVGARPRILAVAALAGIAVLVVATVAFVQSNAAYLVLALVGLAFAIAGGWWTITERMPRRAVGAVGGLVGAVLLVASVIAGASDADRPLLHALIVAVLLAVSMLAARAALVDDLHAVDNPRAGTVSPPHHPVLLCNPWSGGGKVERFGLVQLASELGIETVMLDHGLDLEQLARDAIARGADCLGMAGGDGSQALVAAIAIEHGLPFVCVSAGTRNHFALDLGLDRDDPRLSVHAFKDAVERHVDYGTLNGRLFVNNVSLGVYATIVQQESYRDAKIETSKTLLPEMLGRTEEAFDLQFTTPDGTEVDGAFLVMVSNNPYVLGPALDLAQRRRLDTGTLGVVAVSAATGREAARMVTLSMVGQRRHSPGWHEFTTERFVVRSRSGKAFVGVDGEALEMDTPLDIRIHPRGLRLLVPAGNLDVATQRGAREVSVRDLVSFARGIRPVHDAADMEAHA